MLIDSATIGEYAVRKLRMNVYDKSGNDVMIYLGNSADYILCTASFHTLCYFCVVGVTAAHNRREACTE